MDKIWPCGVIKYLQEKGLTPTKIHADMVDALGDDATSLSTVQKWAAEFKRGQKSLEDDPTSGPQQATVTTPEIIDHVHQLVMGFRQLTISHMAKEVGISWEGATFFTKNLAHPKFLLNGSAARHLIKEALGWSCHNQI